MSANLVPFSSAGGLTTAGNITVSGTASPAPSINGFSSVSSENISLGVGYINGGTATVVTDGINSIQLAPGAQMDVYGFPFSQITRGQLTISGVATPSEVNGTWYYQSVNTNTYQIYTDNTYSTLVNASGWSAYTGGGSVAITKQVPAANIVINSNGYLSTFDNTGNLTVPGSLNSAANLKITANTQSWTFDNAGVLTLPGEGVLQSSDDSVTLRTLNTVSGNANSVYLGTSGGLGFNDQEAGGNWLEIFRTGTEPEIRVPVGRGNLTIQTASGNTPYNWVFDDTGNLTLPANTFAVNYANGTAVSLGSGSSYGNANVATFLAAFGSNTVSTTGNITTGNLRTAGLISATGNVQAGNVSAVGNVIGGNITTAGLITATGNISSGNVLPTNQVVLPNGTAALPSLVWNKGSGDFGFYNNMGTLYFSYSSANYHSINNVRIQAVGATNDVGSPPLAVMTTNNGFYTENSDNTLSVAVVATKAASFNSITNSTSTTTGAIVSTGGIGAAGNIYAGGLISATANITGGNIRTAGQVSATGNITSGNILTGGLISATGNITAAGTGTNMVRRAYTVAGSNTKVTLDNITAQIGGSPIRLYIGAATANFTGAGATQTTTSGSTATSNWQNVPISTGVGNEFAMSGAISTNGEMAVLSLVDQGAGSGMWRITGMIANTTANLYGITIERLA